MKEVNNFKEAIIYIMSKDETVTKYSLAKTLGMSTASMISNILTGYTKRPRKQFVDALYKEFGIKIKGENYES